MDSIFLKIKRIVLTLLVVVIYFCGETYSDFGKMSSQRNNQNHFSSTINSQFITKNNTKVIAQRGGLAILPCAVKLSSPATVSWIRRRDFQLLTVGLSTHSSDARFLVEHTRHMGHWALRIKSVKEEDRGFYECQLSIYPTQSIFIELKVVEAVAEITGAPDLHIDEGSTLRLECKLKRATENPSFVFWYQDKKMVNYDAQDGFSVTSTNVDTMSTTSSSYEGNSALDMNTTNLVPIQSHYLTKPSKSILTIREVHFHHAGNYTCAPSNARSASITVHVLRGEKPAAMQHGNRSVIKDSHLSSLATTIQLSSSVRWFTSYLFIYFILNNFIYLFNTVKFIINSKKPKKYETKQSLKSIIRKPIFL